jgi:hypothetical protein
MTVISSWRDGIDDTEPFLGDSVENDSMTKRRWVHRMGDFVCRGNGEVNIRFRKANSVVAVTIFRLTSCFLLLEMD